MLNSCLVGNESVIFHVLGLIFLQIKLTFTDIFLKIGCLANIVEMQLE